MKTFQPRKRSFILLSISTLICVPFICKTAANPVAYWEPTDGDYLACAEVGIEEEGPLGISSYECAEWVTSSSQDPTGETILCCVPESALGTSEFGACDDAVRVDL